MLFLETGPCAPRELQLTGAPSSRSRRRECLHSLARRRRRCLGALAPGPVALWPVAFRSHRDQSQKESLSEYGSGWEWESNTYAHVFDQTNKLGIPHRYNKDGTGDADNMEYQVCKDDVETTDGQLLSSNTIYTNQTSCRAMASNAGNYYSWLAATAGGSKSSGNENNSMCPRGWQLTVDAASDPKSWYYLIRTAYNIQESNKDERVRPLPLSFIRSGRYDPGLLYDRANYGYYWSSTAILGNYAYDLNFGSNNLNPQYTLNKNRGVSVRCVAH